MNQGKKGTNSFSGMYVRDGPTTQALGQSGRGLSASTGLAHGGGGATRKQPGCAKNWRSLQKPASVLAGAEGLVPTLLCGDQIRSPHLKYRLA